SDVLPKPCCTTSPATTSLSCTLTFCEKVRPFGTARALQVMWTVTPTAAPRVNSSACVPSVTIGLLPAAPAAEGIERATATVPSEMAPSDATRSTPFLRLDIGKTSALKWANTEHGAEERVRTRKAPPRSVADKLEPKPAGLF